MMKFHFPRDSAKNGLQNYERLWWDYGERGWKFLFDWGAARSACRALQLLPLSISQLSLKILLHIFNFHVYDFSTCTWNLHKTLFQGTFLWYYAYCVTHLIPHCREYFWASPDAGPRNTFLISIWNWFPEPLQVKDKFNIRNRFLNEGSGVTGSSSGCFDDTPVCVR
jgi:hypothetical protein